MNKKKIVLQFVLIAVLLAALIAGASFLYPRLNEQLRTLETAAVSAEPTAEQPSVTLAPAAEEPAETQTPAPAAEEPAQTQAPKQAEAAGPVFRNMAADFTAYTDEGEAVSLRSKRGKPVVVNFFASWCGPCKSEMPYFEEFYLEYGDQVEFMMVNLCAFGNDTKDAAKKMVAEGGYTFPVYFDTDGDAMLKYAVRSMPTTLFISSEGELKGQKIGMIDRETLKKTVEAMAAEGK